MGILDSLMKNPDAIVDLAKCAVENPEVAKAAMSLVSSSDASVGGNGGLAGLVGSLQGSGLGDAVSSWLGSGENQAVSGDQLKAALGDDTISQFAEKAGLDNLLGDVLGKLA